MNDSNRKTAVTVVGGDARQKELAALLAAEGYAVRDADEASDASDMPSRAVIFPVRYEGLKEKIVALNDINKENTSEPGSMIFAWSPDAGACEAAKARGYRVFDLAKDEALTVKNALLTAEGALSLFMTARDASVLGSRVLVLGSGRVAKCVCRVFSALGSNVTVAARRREALAWAELFYKGAVPLTQGEPLGREFLSSFDAVLNTVPARVVPVDALSRGALYIELASPPYGVDIEAAKAVGVDVRLASGLPGKYAPVSAARIIADCVIRELGGMKGGGAL